MERVQEKFVLADLQKKLVFLEGPHGVGKRAIAKSIAKQFQSSIHLNCRNSEDQKNLLNSSWKDSTELIILSEIHAIPDWRNFLDKLYKAKKSHQKFLILCSEKIEKLNPISNSLYRLLPMPPFESEEIYAPYSITPCLGSLHKAVAEKFPSIQNLSHISHIFELLQKRVGTPISYLSLGESMGISPNTVEKIIQIFEELYMIFRVSPYSSKITRKNPKEPKFYFFDISLVKGNNGAKFENHIALGLLNHVYSQIDTKSLNYSLHSLRTKDGREVDFALLLDNTIVSAIEVKYSDSGIHPALSYFNHTHHLPCFQVIKDLKHEKSINNISVLKGSSFLKTLRSCTKTSLD